MKKRKDGYFLKQLTIEVKGKKKLKNFYAKSESALNRKILEFKGEKAKGRPFSVVAYEWQEEHTGITYYTADQYKAPLKDVIEEFGETRITDITSGMIQRFFIKKAKLKPAKQTLKLRKIVLNLIFKHAIINGDVELNPVTSCSIPVGLKSEKRKLPEDQIIKKITESTDLPFGMFAYFLLYTGLRPPGEVLAIEWADIDFEKMLITVEKEVIFEHGKPVVIPRTKSHAGTRDVIMLDCLAQKLKGMKRDGKWVFENEGKLLTSKMYRDRWSAYLESINVDGITPYQLRHAYMTVLYEAGVDEKLAQYLGGHASIVTTRNIYTKIRHKKLIEAAENLNKFNP